MFRLPWGGRLLHCIKMMWMWLNHILLLLLLNLVRVLMLHLCLCIEWMYNRRGAWGRCRRHVKLFVAAYKRHHAIVIVTCWVKSRHIFKINNRRWVQQYFSFLPAILETLLKLSSIYLPFWLFILHLFSSFFINFVTLPPNQFLAFHSQLLLLHLLVLLFLNLLVQLPLLLLCHLLF